MTKIASANPCPKCGNDTLYGYEDLDRHIIRCSCGLYAYSKVSEADAIQAWNTGRGASMISLVSGNDHVLVRSDGDGTPIPPPEVVSTSEVARLLQEQNRLLSLILDKLNDPPVFQDSMGHVLVKVIP